MAKFGRLVSGELRKISLRPIMYIITGILVLALILSISLFNPAPRGSNKIEVSPNAITVGEVYYDFDSTFGNYNKSVYDNKLNNVLNKLTYYEDLNADAAISFTEELQAKMGAIYSQSDPNPMILVEFYRMNVQNNGPFPAVPAVKNSRINLLTAFTDLQTFYNKAVNAELISVFLKADEHIAIVELLTHFIRVLNPDGVSFDDIDTHVNIITQMYEGSKLGALWGKLNAIQNVLINEDIMLDLRQNYYDIAVSRLNNALSEILDFNAIYSANTNEDAIELMRDKVRYYYSTIDLLALVVSGAIENEIISGLDDAELHQYLGYNNINTYQIRENHAKNIFMFNADKFAYDYASVFSVSRTSNAESNAFDFMFFGLELFGFIIVISCVVLGAGMVAGESSAGTLKMLAIRPYSRSKILSGKLLATTIFGFTLVIFSALVLFLIGLTLYGANLTPVLAVFNSAQAFVVSPVILMLIYILQLLFKVFIYTLLAVTISTLLKSNVAAVAISILIYFLSSIFGVIFSGSYWYTYVPFTNIDLFKFFGGAFIDNLAGNPLAFVFSSPMLYGMSFWFSFVLDMVLMGLMLVITYLVFKRREIK